MYLSWAHFSTIETLMGKLKSKISEKFYFQHRKNLILITFRYFFRQFVFGCSEWNCWWIHGFQYIKTVDKGIVDGRHLDGTLEKIYFETGENLWWLKLLSAPRNQFSDGRSKNMILELYSLLRRVLSKKTWMPIIWDMVNYDRPYRISFEKD